MTTNLHDHFIFRLHVLWWNLRWQKIYKYVVSVFRIFYFYLFICHVFVSNWVVFVVMAIYMYYYFL